MRFERLHLERYGAFEDVTLDLSGRDVRLHVIYGPNEAGKSTVLSAISDLLFGIPARTPYNFRHDYARLRIGAEVVNAAGQTLAFKRRKANGGTLLSTGAAEAVLPDTALAPFLKGLSREEFTRLFGLNHARLRRGGEQMLDAGGDLARSLFEAGSGLSGVGAVLRAIEQELDDIGSLERRARTKPLWTELDGFAEAAQAVRRDGLKAEEWRRAEERLEKARTERQTIDVALASCRRRSAALERIRRVASILTAIDALSLEIAAAGDLPVLPPGFLEEWRDHDRSLRDARLALRAAEEVERTRASELETLPATGTITSFADAIAEVHAQLGRYRKDAADEPKLTRALAGDEAELVRRLGALGVKADPAGITPLVPTEITETRVRTLSRAGERAEVEAKAAAEALRKAEAEVAAAEASLASLPPALDPALARGLADEAARLGDPEARRARATRDLAAAETALAEALGRLPGWAGTVEALAAQAFPDTEVVRHHEDTLRDTANALAEAARYASSTEDESRRVTAELAGLAAAGEVPSPGAVAVARERRDRIWRALRARHLDGREPGAEDWAALEGADDPGSRFEEALRQADALVDRRESEAQRIARFSDLTAQEVRLASQAAAAHEALAKAQSADTAAQAAWAAVWQPCSVAPGTPAAMRAWLTHKDTILNALVKVRAERAALGEVHEAVAAARLILQRAAQELGDVIASDAPLADVDREVRRRIASAAAHHTVYQNTTRRLAEARERLQHARTTSTATEAAMRDWSVLWAEALPLIGLAPGMSRLEADTALRIWGEIRERLAVRDENARRLAGLQRDNDRLRSDLARLVVAIGADAAGLDAEYDPEGTIAALVTRAAAAREAAMRRAGGEMAHAAALEALATARRDLHAAEAACAAFYETYRLMPDTDVPALAERVVTQQRRLASLNERREALVAASDGLTEAALREEVAGTTSDAAAAELALVQAEEARLVTQSQMAAQEETEAKHALDTLTGRGGVAAQAQRARHHAQAAAGHVERWMRLTAAKRLLERSLERYRAENQHPLVRRGGDIFVRVAGTGVNPFVALDVTYGDGVEPKLIGARRDGTHCGVEGMSEGTLDQLYLSLRMAAIEQHAVGGEPMPFIADDLFITSDEDRVQAGLNALTELGRSTQVILFTHHQHVLRQASFLPTSYVRLHKLTSAGSAPGANVNVSAVA